MKSYMLAGNIVKNIVGSETESYESGIEHHNELKSLKLLR